MSNYPEQIDSNENLYTVHDFLRVKLIEDYTPGDESITVSGDTSNFPATGIITLTEQCSDLDERAISLSYTSRTETTFDGLKLLPNFTEVSKSRRITNVTMNVFADHHNEIKDAIIAIQNFVGIKGDISLNPLEGSMEARINFLRKLVLKPRAWFTATKTVGIRPLCLEFKDFSSRQPEFWTWDFGDGTMSVISRTDTIITGNVSKCFYQPGIYPITLTVENDFGSNSITIPDYITVRVEAPDEATIEFVPTTAQILDGGVIRSRNNQQISVQVDDNGEQPEDPIIRYVWEFGDDLTHEESSTAVASYSLGGFYDVKMKTITDLGAYRVTSFDNVIDIVEKFNVWHMIFDNSSGDTTKTAYTYEFGLLSETYKAVPVSLNVTRDYRFLEGKDEYDRQYAEFRRNNGSNPRNTTASGDAGELLVYWAEGAEFDTDYQNIRFRQLNGFNQVWTTPTLGNGYDTLERYWNWVELNSISDVHFILGLDGPYPFTGSPTNQDFKTISMSGLDITTTTFTNSNYQNGADELMSNVGDDGDFSVYRSAWRDSNGYIVRNDGSGLFFRLKSFYKTSGEPISSIMKMDDLGGATKFEGEIVNLSSGLYFFNNTGEFLIYNPTDNTWSAGGPGINSTDFSALQDTDVDDYNSPTNRLLATSDGDRKAYLFFDYSTRAQIKFNEVDFTFSTLPVRPTGEQFLVNIY